MWRRDEDINGYHSSFRNLMNLLLERLMNLLLVDNIPDDKVTCNFAL